MYKPDEHTEQATLLEWWNLQFHAKPFHPLLFAIPNGGSRHKATAGKLKAEGVRPGVPDLFFACPKGPYHGLWIEMKTGTGKASAAQKEMISLLQAQGYACALCRGYEEARQTLENYLAGQPIPPAAF